jgi:hypothetical protein
MFRLGHGRGLADQGENRACLECTRGQVHSSARSICHSVSHGDFLGWNRSRRANWAKVDAEEKQSQAEVQGRREARERYERELMDATHRTASGDGMYGNIRASYA